MYFGYEVNYLLPNLKANPTVIRFMKSRILQILIVIAIVIVFLHSFIQRTPKLFSNLSSANDNELKHCETLFLANESSTIDYEKLSKTSTRFLDWTTFNDSARCERFKQIEGHNMWSSTEEIQYPLAYIILIYSDPILVARFLRLVYRPQNLYCIHIDRKSSYYYRDKIGRMAQCFGKNVVIVDFNESIDIQWGYYSMLEAYMACAKLLLKNKQIPWKYVINVGGKELPLRTNWEIVRALKAINNSNLLEALELSKTNPNRIPVENVSFSVTWYKGSFLVVLRREFVKFMLTDPKAIELRNLLEGERNLAKHPDETYFSTLAYNPSLNAPGACKQFHPQSDADQRTHLLTRFVIWSPNPCISNLSIRSICMLGVRHVPILVRRPELFANKFVMDFQPLAYDCMEHWIIRKMINEKISRTIDPTFDTTIYRQLYCSTDHLP